MKGFAAAASSLLAGTFLLASTVNAQASTVDPIIVKGKGFYYSTNHTQFYIRGVAYQQDYNSNGTAASNADYTDPLADGAACMRDIPYLKRLRTNVIRTYAVNPTSDHSECMNALAAAGIYVISDLSAPGDSINRNTPSWTTDLALRYTSLIDDLSQYNNVIGFFAGNEVSNSENTTAASAFVKAAVRDTKAYIAQNVKRPLYVGYATSDDATIRDQVAQYMNCGSDVADTVDFYGYNIYSWCGESSYQTSGYQERTQFFADYSVPVFFAEYGCNEVEPRPFTEVGALFSKPMTNVWSGGIVYMYFQEANNYGLVTVSGNSVTPRQDFDNLSSQIAKVSPSATDYDSVNTATLSATTCPSVDATWLATSTPLPPTPNADFCNCIEPALNCVVKQSTSETDYGDLFNYICGSDPDYCTGTLHNATTGQYGTFGMCDSMVQLSYVMDRYYVGQGASASNCAFSGAATVQAATKPTGTCVSLIQAAGKGGTATVSGGLSGGTASASSSGNAAPRLSFSSPDRGMLYLGIFIVGAAATGAGMIVL